MARLAAGNHRFCIVVLTARIALSCPKRSDWMRGVAVNLVYAEVTQRLGLSPVPWASEIIALRTAPKIGDSSGT